MDINNFKEKLKGYNKQDIIITEHAKIRAFGRGINLEEVKDNIINPFRLVHFEEQKAKYKDEKKYACYFAYSRTYCHKYVLTLNRKVIIITIININRDWQKIIRI